MICIHQNPHFSFCVFKLKTELEEILIVVLGPSNYVHTNVREMKVI